MKNQSPNSIVTLSDLNPLGFEQQADGRIMPILDVSLVSDIIEDMEIAYTADKMQFNLSAPSNPTPLLVMETSVVPAYSTQGVYLGDFLNAGRPNLT